MLGALAATLACVAPADAQEPSPDAATIYRRAFAALREALRLDTEDPVDYPWVDEPSAAVFSQAPWPELIARTAVARTLFAQASAVRECAFDQPTGELGLADEVQERVADFRALQTFVVAHAFTVVASRPEVAVSDVEALFACARHLEQQPGLFAALLATDFADGAARVCDTIAAAPVEPATRRAILQRTLTALAARERTRSDLPKLAARAIVDADKLLSLLVEPDSQNGASIRAAKKRARELVQELVEPLRTAKAGAGEELKKTTAKHLEKLKARYRGQRTNEVLASGTGEALAAVLASLVAPNSAALFDQWERHGERLAALKATLRRRRDILR